MPYDRAPYQIKPAHVTSYAASYTLSKLHLSTASPLPFAQLRGIMGPLGSGKSVGCCWEIMQQACRMPPVDTVDARGKPARIRRSRWVVVRNTYRELEDTTIATWFDWFPEEQYGPLLRRGMTHQIRRTLDDGTLLELDVLFRALDKPQDVRKLLSLELTGAWVNEAREVPRAVIDMLRKRVGRFPKYGSTDPYWHGVIMDTNPPEDDSWYYRYAESTDWSADRELLAQLNERGFAVTVDDLQSGFMFYRQPSGRRAGAENLANLPPGYYSTVGLTDDWVKVYIDGEYGYVQTGKAIYPEFYETIHYVESLAPINAPIIVGLDFGLTPAAAFIQQDPRGRYLVIDELCTDLEIGAAGAVQFAKELRAKIDRDYPGYAFKFYGDPAGDERSPLDADQSVFKVLAANGILAQPAVTQDWVRRRDAIGVPLNQLVDGRPGLIVGGKAKMIRQGLAGRYNYKRVQIAGDERYHNKPDKNAHSHPVEALQYGMLGAGSDPIRKRGPARAAPGYAHEGGGADFNVWDSRPCPTLVPLAASPAILVPIYLSSGSGSCISSLPSTCAPMPAALLTRSHSGAGSPAH